MKMETVLENNNNMKGIDLLNESHARLDEASIKGIKRWFRDFLQNLAGDRVELHFFNDVSRPGEHITMYGRIGKQYVEGFYVNGRIEESFRISRNDYYDGIERLEASSEFERMKQQSLAKLLKQIYRKHESQAVKELGVSQLAVGAGMVAASLAYLAFGAGTGGIGLVSGFGLVGFSSINAMLAHVFGLVGTLTFLDGMVTVGTKDSDIIDEIDPMNDIEAQVNSQERQKDRMTAPSINENRNEGMKYKINLTG